MSDAIDLHQCELTPNAGIADWAQTTDISQLDVRPSGLHIEFSKKDGPDRWPDVIPPGWTGPIQYTIWFGALVNGAPTFAACLNWWHGRSDNESGPVTDPQHYPRNLWYLNDALKGHAPSVGETLGCFLTAGAARGIAGNYATAVRERSNVVTFTMPSGSGQTFTYSSDPIPPGPPPTPSDAVMAKLHAMDAKLDRLINGLDQFFS